MTDTIITLEQRAALDDAHLSVNHGGLVEATSGKRGTCWVGAHDACTDEHRPHVISELRDRGLVEVIGSAPMRTAHITEIGIMERDIAQAAHADVQALRTELATTLEPLTDAQVEAAARLLVIEHGGTLVSPQGEMGPLDYELSLLGITGFGPTLAAAARQWTHNVVRIANPELAWEAAE